jgi:hypothetical protein
MPFQESPVVQSPLHRPFARIMPRDVCSGSQYHVSGVLG